MIARTAWYSLLSYSLLAASALVVVGGCQGVHWSNADLPFKSPPLTKKKKDQPVTPERLSVIWTPTTMQFPGQPMKSGFGGQVYFFDSNSRPVRVEGDFIIYGFDETNHRASHQADHKYVFKRETLQNHFRETAVGPSYSFWIPWQDADGPRKQIALLPVFKAADGAIVKGDQSITILPGTMPESDRSARSTEPERTVRGSALTNPVKATTHHHAVVAQAQRIDANEAQAEVARKSGLRTTTIEMPRRDEPSSSKRDANQTINGQAFGVITTETHLRTVGNGPDERKQ